MRPIVLAALVFLSTSASAQLLTSTPHGIVVAQENRVAIEGKWSAEGVANPTAIVASDTQVVVLDALKNEAVIVELANGRANRTATSETPIAAAFVGREIYILSRDARLLRHGRARIPLAADPSFLRTANNGKLYVYSRAAGIVEEIDRDQVTRRVSIAPFASDFEISGTTAYLVYPRDARIRTIDLAAMKAGDEIRVGAVPVDLAFAGGGTALTARVLAVADPSAKRVWLAEGTQSLPKAIARGFVRGFLGLGLYGNRASQFPTGVDRVEVRGSQWIAYDTSSGTLYRFTRKKSSVIAKNVPPGAFALTEDGVAWWTGTSVAQMRLR